MLSRRCIDEIRLRANIVDVCARVVHLKQKGRKWLGLSPFKAEKTPSFNVDAEKGFFYCFSTQTGGDVFKFVQLTENLTFMEAAEQLAQRFGVALEFEDGKGPTTEERSLKKQLLELHDYAADYFHRAFLKNDEAGKGIRAYWLEQRHFHIDVAIAHKVGFAPADGGGLGEHLRKKGFTMEALKQSGLFYENAESPIGDARKLRPRFKGRLMIPIRDMQGQVIAFTARVTPQTPKDDITYEAKYVNSPETVLFKKDHVVFNLHLAKDAAKKVGSFVIVEGQLDCIRCHSEGVTHAVALQGSASSEYHMIALKRFVDKLDVLLDGDLAGQKAALRLLPLALQAGLEPRFLPLPDKVDPDLLFSDQGSAAFEKLVATAQSPVAFLVKSYLPDPTKASAVDRSKAVSSILEMLSNLESGRDLQLYFQEAMQRLLVAPFQIREYEAAFAQMLSDKNRRTRRISPSGEGVSGAKQEGDTPTVSEQGQRLTNAEGDLLFILLHHLEVGQQIAHHVSEDWIDPTSTDGSLLARILAAFRFDMWDGVQPFMDELETDAERSRCCALLAEDCVCENLAQALAECLRKLWLKYLQREIAKADTVAANAVLGSVPYRQSKQRKAELQRLRLAPPDFSNLLVPAH